MDVTIQESRFSFRIEYQITAPGTTLTAKKLFSFLMPSLQIQSASSQVIATLRKSSFFTTKYDFQFADKAPYQFSCEKAWKQVYLCEGDGQTYHLYCHRGLRYSIFQNDTQIAAYSKNRVVWGAGNRYDLQMNSDADLLVLASMVLTLSIEEDNNDQTTVNIDLGNIGPQDRPVDETWLPH